MLPLKADKPCYWITAHSYYNADNISQILTMKNNDITEILARSVWLRVWFDSPVILRGGAGSRKLGPAAFDYSFIFCSGNTERRPCLSAHTEEGQQYRVTHARCRAVCFNRCTVAQKCKMMLRTMLRRCSSRLIRLLLTLECGGSRVDPGAGPPPGELTHM